MVGDGESDSECRLIVGKHHLPVFRLYLYLILLSVVALFVSRKPGDDDGKVVVFRDGAVSVDGNYAVGGSEVYAAILSDGRSPFAERVKGISRSE